MNNDFEDTKRVIRIRKSKKDRKHNGHKNKDKQRSTKHIHKTNDQVTRHMSYEKQKLKTLRGPQGSLPLYSRALVAHLFLSFPRFRFCFVCPQIIV